MREHELFIVWFFRLTAIGLAVATWWIGWSGKPEAILTGIGCLFALGLASSIAADAHERETNKSTQIVNRRSKAEDATNG